MENLESDIVAILKFILWRKGSQCNSERSLNLDRKVACMKERFAKCEMRMEKVSGHDFRSNIGV